MVERTGRTVICSVVFMDIVGYSKTPVSQQMAMKERLNEIVADAVSGVPEGERIIIDAGDGLALCFLGDPEDALFVATAVNGAVRKAAGDAAQTLRIGINLGPVKVVTDLSGGANVVGDGINVAQRVMSFAGDDEVLVSRSYYEVVARLHEGNEKLFRYLGVKKDKHVREHQVYAFGPEGVPGGAGAKDRAAAPAAATPAALGEDVLAAEERRLAERIGPLAKVIVRRAAQSSESVGAFYRTIAAVIPDEADRAAFLAGAVLREEAVAAPAEAAASSSAPAPEAVPQRPIAEDDLQAAERRLASVIGPLAGLLVRRAAEDAVDLGDLYDRLADNINDESERKRFLAAAAGGS